MDVLVVHHHEDHSSTEEQLLYNNHHQKKLLLDAFEGHPKKQEMDRYTMLVKLDIFMMTGAIFKSSWSSVDALKWLSCWNN